MKLSELSTEHALCFQVSGVTLKVNGPATQLSPQRHAKKCDGFSTDFKLLLTFYISDSGR